MTNMFDNVEVVPTFEDLVGEGKKYASSEELARAVYFKDKHIGTIEGENKEYKTKVATATSLETVMAAIKGNTQNSQAPVSTSTVSTETKDDAQFERVIQEYLHKQQIAREREDNQKLIKQWMFDAYKDKAGERFAQVAGDSGFTTDQLEQLASTNPKAFAKLAGLDQTNTRQTVTPAKGSVNPQALQAQMGNKGKAGTKSYWDNFKKDHPSMYFNPKIQTQIREDFDRDPDYFENN